MPHRTTYIFPRQFPERGFDESSKQFLDHEKKKLVNSIKSSESNSNKKRPPAVSTTPQTKDDIHFSSGDISAVSDLFTSGEKFRAKKKQIAAFCDWLIEKKRDRSDHLKSYRRLSCDEDCELFHPPETVKDTAIDQKFDRQVSLPRLSSGSSYDGSLFSGTTLDGNFSSDIKEETLSSRVSSTPTRRQEDKEEEEASKETLAQKYRESYYLQLTLAKRITCLASLSTEPALTHHTGIETWDPETVSYRLWV